MVVAWCTGYLATLPTPNPVRDPAAFTAALHRLDHVDVPVTCHGPPVGPGVGGVDVTWTLDTTLNGDNASLYARLIAPNGDFRVVFHRDNIVVARRKRSAT